MKFYNEIERHNARGYHRIFKYSQDFNSLCIKEGYMLNPLYIDFIDTIGYGYFFGGSLVLFPLYGEKGSIRAVTKSLQGIGIEGFIAIGYAGTTDGYYCLKNDEKDVAIYWADIQQKIVKKLSDRFDEWINSQPDLLFNAEIYAAYTIIKDLSSVYDVIEERSFVEVELLDFERQLVKPPGKEKDFLPRYNKLTIAVRKNKDLKLLNELTIKFFREGSSIGKDNVEYLTIDISSLPINETGIVHAYLFDPFNLPFEKIESLYNPEIDITNKMRIRYQEIKKYL